MHDDYEKAGIEMAAAEWVVAARHAGIDAVVGAVAVAGAAEDTCNQRKRSWVVAEEKDCVDDAGIAREWLQMPSLDPMHQKEDSFETKARTAVWYIWAGTVRVGVVVEAAAVTVGFVDAVGKKDRPKVVNH